MWVAPICATSVGFVRDFGTKYSRQLKERGYTARLKIRSRSVVHILRLSDPKESSEVVPGVRELNCFVF
jgi:hypothetical protein